MSCNVGGRSNFSVETNHAEAFLTAQLDGFQR